MQLDWRQTSREARVPDSTIAPHATAPDVREKWNRRYADKLGGDTPPEPNPLALRFAEHVSGGLLLDAACGLGTGIAAALDRVDHALGVDLSESALAAARQRWGDNPRISWVQADVVGMPWPTDTFAMVCAFGFTDWEFLRQVPRILRPGGLFCYQGFSRRQLEVKPSLDPAWTSTPHSIAALFPGWKVLACEESDTAPFRVSFAALKPTQETSADKSGTAG